MTDQEELFAVLKRLAFGFEVDKNSNGVVFFDLTDERIESNGHVSFRFDSEGNLTALYAG